MSSPHPRLWRYKYHFVACSQFCSLNNQTRLQSAIRHSMGQVSSNEKKSNSYAQGNTEHKIFCMQTFLYEKQNPCGILSTRNAVELCHKQQGGIITLQPVRLRTWGFARNLFCFTRAYNAKNLKGNLYIWNRRPDDLRLMLPFPTASFSKRCFHKEKWRSTGISDGGWE